MTKARDNANNWAADITGVTAGTGITGGGTSGTVTVTADTSVVTTLTGTQTLTNKTVTAPILIAPEERWTISATAATGIINFDTLTQGVLYYTTNASGNFTLNFRGDGSNTLNSTLVTGDTITVSFLVTNGGTAYYANAFQVDGSSVTPKWSGGTAPASGNASAIDAYIFTIIKTADATFTVLAAGPIKYS